MTGFLRRNAPALIVLAAGVCMIVLGVARGEMQTVWRKAVNICMECVGIG